MGDKPIRRLQAQLRRHSGIAQLESLESELRSVETELAEWPRVPSRRRRPGYRPTPIDREQSREQTERRRELSARRGELLTGIAALGDAANLRASILERIQELEALGSMT
jgi:hypothetical protein